MNKTKIKKIINIACSVIVYLFLVICIVAVVMTIVMPKSYDGATEIFGYQLRLVTTNSMAKGEQTDTSDYAIKSIPAGSMVFIKTLPDDDAAAAEWYENEVSIGDVLTFKYLYEKQLVITHRVVDKYPNPDGEGYVIELEGDNKDSDTNLLRQVIYTAEDDATNYIIGEVKGQSRILGFFVGAMKQPVSLLLLIILPCFVIIVSEIIKIINVLNADKREKHLAEKKQKDDEILELKRQIEALKQKDAFQCPEIEKNPDAEDNISQNHEAESAEETDSDEIVESLEEPESAEMTSVEAVSDKADE